MIALMLAGVFSLAYSLFLTPLFVKGFKRLEWGQFIREDGPTWHETKRGTPTMGGIVFLSGTVISYFLAKILAGSQVSASVLLVLLLSLGCALVGFIDDYIKVRQKRSLGLHGWGKIAGQVIVGGTFAVLSLNFANQHGITPASTAISLFRDTGIDFMALGLIVGIALFVAWVILITTSTSNAVNLTDGLDGLAAGISILVFGGYIFIGLWQSNQLCGTPKADLGCYTVRDPMDLAVIAAAFAGGLVGFLWWNTSPAKLFMGDTGSMGIGGAVAALAILSRTELLLIVLGAVYIAEAGSVILQRAYFKATKGKRIFLMSPIHHHFELKGWEQVTVVVRFWLVAGMFVILGVGLFYAEWIIGYEHH